MPLRLILGNSGSGKSYNSCKEMVDKSIQNPYMNFIAVVPEQFTLQTQKDIVMMHPKKGVMNIDIVSFDRLAYRVFQEMGVKNLETLDDTGKSLVLRKVIEDNKDSLKVFKSKIKMPGFVEEMKSVIAEFYQYGIDDEGIENIIRVSSSKPLLHEKLKETALIYRKFKKYLEEKYVTSEEILEKLCKLIPDSEVIKKSEIYLDGFTGFTPVQYKLIGVLLKYAKNVSVCVTIDTRELKLNIIKEHELFNLSKVTVSKLTNLAIENNVEILPHLIMEVEPLYRFKNSPALSHIERYIYRDGKVPKGRAENNIKIDILKNPNSEIEYVAGAISSLIREQGYRYRDIAVITGNMEANHRRIENIFAINNIPNFIDYKKNIVANPLVEGISSVLEVMEKDFSYESIFRFLRSGMCPVEMDEVDKLENFVLGRGIRGKKSWEKSWNEELDPVKDRFMEPLKKLAEDFRVKDQKLKSYMTSLYEFIISMDMKGRLKVLSEMFEKEKELRMMEEYSRVYGMTMELFDKTVLLLGDEKVSLKEFAVILASGFAEIKVGIIPPTTDTVVIGDIERTRLKDIKVLFIINVNEGIIPSSSVSSGLISDKERMFLKNEKVELSPTLREKLFIQKFYLYLNLTKPSEKLFITLSKNTSDGKSLRPSYLVWVIASMFEDLCISENDDDFRFESITSRETGLSYLAKSIYRFHGFEMDNISKELLSVLLKEKGYAEKVRRIIDSAFPETENSILDSLVSRTLYKEDMNMSVSRLEKYAKCAYSHFLRYGLNLVPRKEYRIESVDLGNLYHEALEIYNEKLGEMGLDFKTVSEDESREIVKECIEKVTGDYGNTVFESSARNKYIVKRLERITNKTIWALSEHQKKEKFEAKYFEKDFIFDLKGRIDRIDTYSDGDDIFVKVIDYKSGNNVYSIVDTYYNLQMQLVVYMDKAMEIVKNENPGKNILPGGIFYYQIKDPYVKRGDDKINEFKMNGVINELIVQSDIMDQEIYKKGRNFPALKTEEFYSLIDHVNSSVKNINLEIVNGKIDVNPCQSGGHLPCEYCEYTAVCGFDTGLYDYQENKKPPIEAQDVLNLLREGEK